MRLSLVVSETIQKLDAGPDIRPGTVGWRADSARRRKIGEKLFDAVATISQFQADPGSRARDAQALAVMRYRRYVGEDVILDDRISG